MLPVVLYIFVKLTCCNTFKIHLNHAAGAPRFCLLTPVVAYSVCLFLLFMVSIYCNVPDRMATILERKDFDHKIYSILLIFYSACSMFSPIFMASNTKKLVHYTSEWVQFQFGCILKDRTHS